LDHVDPLGLHLLGISLGGTAFGGPGLGAAATLSGSMFVDTSTGEIGGVLTHGGFVSGTEQLGCDKWRRGAAAGGYAGAGFSGFWSNARRREDLLGPAQTTAIGIWKFYLEVSATTGRDGNPVVAISLGPPRVGIGGGIGIAFMETRSDALWSDAKDLHPEGSCRRPNRMLGAP
jgi:hypothetical protein